MGQDLCFDGGTFILLRSITCFQDQIEHLNKNGRSPQSSAPLCQELFAYPTAVPHRNVFHDGLNAITMLVTVE